MNLKRTAGVGFYLAFSGLLGIAAWGAGCGDDSSDAAPPNGQAGAGGGEDAGTGGAFEGGQDADPLPPDTVAMLEVYPVDIWSQFLPLGEYALDVTLDNQPMASSGAPVLVVPLKDAGTIRFAMTAPDYEDLNLEMTYGGTDQLAGVMLNRTPENAGHGISLAHEMRTVDDRQIPVHSVFLGLRHKWFSASGRPARRGNDVTLLMDGEEAWSAAHEDLVAATTSIHVSTWWWESNFELIRDPATHIDLTTAERSQNTIMGILERSAATKRVVVGQFLDQDGLISWITADDKLKAYAEAPNDGFEFMGQSNPTQGQFQFEVAPFLFADRVRDVFPETTQREWDSSEVEVQSRVPTHMVDLTQWPIGVDVLHASYHQKFLVIDADIAYIGGMNYRRVDWDTSAHDVFNYRRMLFGASQADRQAVQNKERLPDTGPRKDYILRVQGPSAQDAADVFHRRWSHLIDTEVTYHDRSTLYDVDRNIVETPGGPQVQVTATLPQPFWEHAIAETWLNAVSLAESYIFIEDQYFRAPLLNDAIVARMDAMPNLKLFVITKPVDEWTDPGCAWTHEAHQMYKSKYPGRYMMMQLRAFDTNLDGGIIDETKAHFMNMDVHSKMLIVDDRFMSVGSANKNNRGMIYEGELNAAVLDAEFVRETRQRIFTNILPPGVPPTDDPAVFWTDFAEAMVWNDQVYGRWESEGFDLDLDGDPVPVNYVPHGMLYTLSFRTVSDCLIESIGPDMVTRPGD